MEPMTGEMWCEDPGGLPGLPSTPGGGTAERADKNWARPDRPAWRFHAPLLLASSRHCSISSANYEGLRREIWTAAGRGGAAPTTYGADPAHPGLAGGKGRPCWASRASPTLFWSGGWPSRPAGSRKFSGGLAHAE